ncbi:MAG: protein kinase domain-containing protein [Planctomycetaceae bacterium]
MTIADTCPFADLIPDYFSGELSDGQASEFEIHIDQCPRCLALLANQRLDSSDESWLQRLQESPALAAAFAGTETPALQQGNSPVPQIDASALAPAADLGPRYITTRRIGSGGSGEVWEARDLLLQRTVAIKLLRSTAQTLHESQRLMVEAAALARLAHPHIVSLYEVESFDNRPALIMEFISGPSLATWLRQLPRPADAARCIEQMCQAVEHAHAQGVVHRDLKPSNILLKPVKAIPDGQIPLKDQRPLPAAWCPKIADFGLAKLIDRADLTLSGQQIGTPAYMAPEQVLPGRSDPAIEFLVDIYGLGAVLYELLTGRPPFVSSDPALTMAMILREDPIAPRVLTPAIPRDLETICLKCLQKEPSGRYQSAAELQADLRAFLENRPIAARPVSVPRKLLNWCRRHPSESIAASVSAALLLALTLGSLWSAALLQQARQEALAAAKLATENQLLEKQQKEAVLQKFERTLQSHLHFLSMIDDPNSVQPDALQRIRAGSLVPAAEMAMQYIELLNQNLQSGEQLSVAEVSVALNSIALALEARLNIDFEPLLNDLQTLVASTPPDNRDPNSQLELQVRFQHVRATALGRKGQHSDAGDAFCTMADLISQQMQNLGTEVQLHTDRCTARVYMLLNAQAEYKLANRPDNALQALRQADQGSLVLIQSDPKNINSMRLFLESRLLLAQLLPPEDASPLAAESLELAAQTEWDSTSNAQSAHAMLEQLRTMIRQTPGSLSPE